MSLNELFLARRCAICGSADVMAVCPGADAMRDEVSVVRADGSTVRYMRQRRAAIPDVNLCLVDWLAHTPYKSHPEPRKRRAVIR